MVTYWQGQIPQVLAIQENCNGIYWTIRGGGSNKSPRIFYNDATGSQQIQTSKEKLSRYLASLPMGNTVFISFSDKTNEQKAIGGNVQSLATCLYCSEPEPGAAQRSYNALNGVQQQQPLPQFEAANDNKYWEARMDFMQKEFEYKNQIANLQRQIDEIKNEGTDWSQLAGIFQQFIPQKGAVATMPAQVVNGADAEKMVDDESKLSEIVGELYKLEGDALCNQLNLLLKLRQQNNEMYQQAIGMAKNLVS